MKYVALLRGINAGKIRRVEMKKLQAVFAALGYMNISTYINSGNVIFSSKKTPSIIQRDLEKNLKKEFGFAIPTLVKTEKEMQKIAQAIPATWQNDAQQRTDVAYLFKEADSNMIIDELPIKKEFIDVRYIKGAMFWNVRRADYNKSHLNKVVGCKIYQFMTVRNVNTAKFLAGIKKL